MAGNNKPNDNDRKRPQGPAGGGKGPGGPRNPQNFMSRGVFGWLLLGGLGLLLIVLINNANPSAQDIPWNDFLTKAHNGAFTKPVIVEDERLVGIASENNKEVRYSTKISPQTKQYYIEELNRMPDPAKHEQWSWTPVNGKAGGPIGTQETPGSFPLLQILIYWGPVFLIILLVYVFVFRTIRNAGGGPGMLGNFGRSRHKVTNKEHSNVTLADVAGIDEAKDEVGEIIEFLKNPKKFQRLGGRVPRGVLLIGDPGCGKTLLAKAVAGEADVPFFSISGSDFVEMFVGVGASRVRDLFKQAKDSAPCIIFLDEIDAVGRRRGSGFTSGGHDEREQTLNAILVEMDGFDTNDQVIVMAATNRADVLDPALTRPGRFDRQITVPLPDLRGRMEILKVHSKRVKMSPSVDLEKLARGTPMFSGADLAAIINEAAIGATLLGKDFVEQEDLEEARDKVKWGRARKSRKIEEEDRVLTAYHEAGHAVIQKLLPYADPLHKVTIIPRGAGLGATISMPEKDRYTVALRYLQATMRVLCGGRIAEQRKTGQVCSGAAMDIRMVTNIARHMVLEWGMSDKLGFVLYSGADTRETFMPEKDYSDETAHVIDEEIKRIIDEAYADATRLINENWDKVVGIAEALLRYETLSNDDVDRIMRGEQIVKPTVGDLLRAEQDKAKERAKPARPETPDFTGDAPGVMPSPA